MTRISVDVACAIEALEIALSTLASRVELLIDENEELKKDVAQIAGERNELAARVRGKVEWATRRCECSAEDICKIVRERDDARAEVERMDAALVKSTELAGEATEASLTAFRRGAEAMREACVKACLNAPPDTHRTACATAMLDLSIPEDR